MSELTQLGNKTPLPTSPLTAVIEKIENPDVANPYSIRLNCPEFCSLCEVTSAPDFANIIIDYIPNLWLIESKSLKLYLSSFRNFNCFHERCITTIGSRLNDELQPHWIRVKGLFFPRGGISIEVFYVIGQVPGYEIYIPDGAEGRITTTKIQS